jgi:hypothetical protein
MSKEYSDLLKDPRWQKKRLEIMKRDKFTCQLCTDTKSTLHIHHKEYIKGKDPWDYSDNILITLCEFCHNLITDGEKNNLKFLNTIKSITLYNEEKILKIFNDPSINYPVLIAIGEENSYKFFWVTPNDIKKIIKILKNK